MSWNILNFGERFQVPTAGVFISASVAFQWEDRRISGKDGLLRQTLKVL